MLRAVLGVLCGGVLWMVVFSVLARGLVLAWPAYAAHAHAWMTAEVYDFTPLMSVLNATFWIASEMAAGWLTVVIARRREAVWILAALVMGYLCFMHLYYVWDRLPWWYNLLVAIPSGPAVLLGGQLARHPSRAAPTVVAQ